MTPMRRVHEAALALDAELIRIKRLEEEIEHAEREMDERLGDIKAAAAHPSVSELLRNSELLLTHHRAEITDELEVTLHHAGRRWWVYQLEEAAAEQEAEGVQT